MIEVLKTVTLGSTIYRAGEHNIDNPSLLEQLREAGAFDTPTATVIPDGVHVSQMSPMEQAAVHEKSRAYYVAKSRAASEKLVTPRRDVDVEKVDPAEPEPAPTIQPEPSTPGDDDASDYQEI